MNFAGKLLVRKAINKDTQKPMLIVCGWIIPEETIEINPSDEMWAVNFTINNIIRFVNSNNMNFSPEDFLENANNVQSPALWEKKE